MNNLFYREKETWFIWTLWGMLGAGVVYYLAKNSDSVTSIVVAGIIFLSVLTWRMASTKRFSFWRAMRITALVFMISTMPILLFNFESVPLFNGIDLGIRLLLLVILGVVTSLFCALIAKQPKQYY